MTLRDQGPMRSDASRLIPSRASHSTCEFGVALTDADAGERRNDVAAAKGLALQVLLLRPATDHAVQQRFHAEVAAEQHVEVVVGRLLVARQHEVVEAADPQCRVPEADGDARAEQCRDRPLAFDHPAAGIDVARQSFEIAWVAHRLPSSDRSGDRAPARGRQIAVRSS
jgi:hypothetical protein